jgi:putative salt-induced outer membrane protein YdiY
MFPHFTRILLSAPLLIGLTAFGDTLTLKNGDRITGKVVKKDGDSLVFKGDLTGEVTVSWAAVSGLTTDEPVTVVLPEGKTILGQVATEQDKVSVTAGTTTQTAPLADVKAMRNAAEQQNYERLLNPGLGDLWAGYVDLGYAVTRGNARTNTLTSAFNAVRATRTDKTTLYFNQVYSTATINRVGGTTAQAVRGGWAYNRNISGRAFLNLFNDYEYDRFQNLDLRFVLGGGAGYTMVKNERSRLDVLGGAAYNREKFGPQDATVPAVRELIRNSAEAYWGNDFSYKLNASTSFRQSYRMFNNLSNTGAYRINFDLGLATQLRKWLSWQVTASDRFLSNPIPGRQKNDLLLTTGVRVNFAR